MKGNEKDCICHKPKGKHTKKCDQFRLQEFLITTVKMYNSAFDAGMKNAKRKKSTPPVSSHSV